MQGDQAAQAQKREGAGGGDDVQAAGVDAGGERGDVAAVEVHLEETSDAGGSELAGVVGSLVDDELAVVGVVEQLPTQ